MEFHLYYKSYSANVTIGGLRKYRELTDRCLLRDLNRISDIQQQLVAMESGEANLSLRCSAILEFMDVLTASAFFYCCNEFKNPLAEFEDAVIRAGTRAVRDDPTCLPWQLVAAGLAIDYDSQFLDSVESESQAKKKAVTSA